MDKLIVDRNGSVDEYVGRNMRKHVCFPVYLSVKHSVNGIAVYHDFILNISKGGVFIKTDSPFSKGTKLSMHIYIPPDSMLLGEFKAKVVALNLNDHSYPNGMHLKLLSADRESMKRLEAYLEEKVHLVDMQV